jgi:hypothetical protein
MLNLARTAVVDSRALLARSAALLAETYVAISRGRTAIANSRRLLAIDAGVPAPETVRPDRRERRKHNKLVYKDRWLISCDVVAALRRAGVICNIMVVDEEGQLATLPLLDCGPVRRTRH